MGGWQVPGYAETAELGRGGTGRVVAAVDVASGERVAIKYLAGWLAGEQRFRDAFRAEAAILAGLRLPHVAAIRRYVEWDGGAAIIMQLVDGVPLRAILTAAGPTDPLAALSVLRGSLLGLAGAHAHGVVHRDYKPENVIVEAGGSSMLVDFGIAQRSGTQHSPAGTPGYMAPEQWAGGSASPATDIYAAAVTYTECLTGRPPPARPPRPASGGQHPATTSADRDGAAPADTALPGGTGPDDGRLASLIARATSASPVDRPATAAEFLTELELAADQQYGPGWPAAGRAALARAAALVAGAAAGAAIGAAAAGQAAPATAAPVAKATTRFGRRAGRRAARTAARTGKAGLSHGAIAGIGAAAAVTVGAAVTVVVLTHHHHQPAPAGTAHYAAAGAGAKWTAAKLIITPHSLGAVTIGMTIARASAAAGEPLVQVGDGFIYPHGDSYSPFSMGPGTSTKPGLTDGCVAARLTAGAPTVVTPQGFRLGGTLAQLKVVYGSKLRYVRPPTFEGVQAPPGYVVSYPDGNLAFGISGNTVKFIAGGPGILSTIGC